MNIGFLMYGGVSTLETQYEGLIRSIYGYCYMCAWVHYYTALRQGIPDAVICSDILETL